MATRLRHTIRLVAALGLVAILAVPTQAAGASKNSKQRCGGRWDAAATCNFRYAGGALTVDGSFEADELGFVTVTLEAVDAATGARVPLLNCGIAGTSFGACTAVTTDSPTIELERGQKLFCSVEGAEAGRYRCASPRD